MKRNAIGPVGRLLVLMGCIQILSLSAVAGEPETNTSRTSNEAGLLAARIDALIAQRWEADAITPAPVADDAEFFRRVYLDLAGKIPPVSELRAFLDDPSPDKRRKAVDRLLESPAYIVHFTNVWRDIMIPEAKSDPQLQNLLPSFEAWLRKQFTDGATYADIAREILTLPLDGRERVTPDGRPNELTPIAFYQAKQVQPESLAASTARIFLGLRIECAQCHDHPFDSWKRKEFWGLAAFYAGVQRQGDNAIFGAVRERLDRREITIPDTDTVVPAAFLDGTEPRWQLRERPRNVLADWILSEENPYFAPAAVNRLWAHLFGIGLVDPADDFSSLNPPSHPELLDELARAFVAHNYDMKFLIRAITSSRTYQLTSEQTHPSQDDPQSFARMNVKGLSPEQLFNSLSQATGFHQPYSNRNPFVFNAGSPQAEFLRTFSNDSDSPIEQTTTILQALAMMNGRFIAEATDLESSRTLSAIAKFPLLDTAGRIEAVYLAVLSRMPRPEELSRLTEYVDSGGPTGDSQQALCDVYWALLNSSEFMFNH